jgi:hypothetical protein
LGHFPETLEFAPRIEREWSLNLTRTTPGPEADAWPCGTERCCELRKVEPLKRAVAGTAAWITSVKRVDAPSRANMKTLMWDEKFKLVKVNPLATWSDDDVAYYLRRTTCPSTRSGRRATPRSGAPVTEKPLVPGDRRSGRWVGADKEECGLHEADIHQKPLSLVTLRAMYVACGGVCRMLLIILALFWVALLAPVAIRRLRDAGAERSIQSFHAEHEVLSRQEYAVNPAHRLDQPDQVESPQPPGQRSRLTVVHADDTYRSLESRSSWDEWADDYEYDDDEEERS